MIRALQFIFFIVPVILVTGFAASAQAPVANFSGTPLNSCSAIVVQFTDLSTNTPTSWSWNLGNGTISTVQNPSTSYTTPGTYTVVLTVSNASGSSTKTITNYVTILPAPVANFAANDSLPACSIKTVQFTNLSLPGTAGAASYYWDFGDGTTSSAANPAHTFNIPGVYNISLIITNSAGCSKILAKYAYIQILPKPTAGFTATGTTSCNVPATTSFSNASSGAVTYDWNFGDGGTSAGPSPTHTYATAGAYSVRLIVTNSDGCKDTLTKPAFVNIGNLLAGFTPSTTATCTGNTVAFANTTIPGGGNYSWSFGDGGTSTLASPVHAYTTAGTYIVKLIASYINGCIDSATHTVTVSAGPNVQFTGGPLVSCSAPLTTSFTNSTSGAVSYLWLFGDGGTNTSASPAHTYNAMGNYTVKLIATSANGCIDTLTKANYVLIQPTVATISGNANLGCAPATGNFSANVSSVVPVASYAWSFGDGGTGSGLSVSHAYAAAGTYTVTLTVTTTTGCIVTTTLNVSAGLRSTPAFTATPTTTCSNSPVQFINSSTGATSYYWNLGDGSTSTAANPTHIYAPGTYTVTLVSSNNGCADTLTRVNYIIVLPPAARFNFTYPCTNRKQVTFINTSVGATNSAWNFGDGSGTSTVTSPVHIYAGFGSYSVVLIATNSTTGCADTITKVIRVYDLKPAFTTSDTVLCKGTSAIFTHGGYYGFTYSFGDGLTFTGGANTYVVAHTYNTIGLHTVKLVTFDEQGCTDSTIKPNHILVKGPAVAYSNTPFAGCGIRSVTFTDLSTPAAGSSIANRRWVFGDGSTLTTTATTATHVYAAAGTYSVTLIVTQADGCKDSLTKSNLTLTSNPVAQFITPDPLSCLNKLVNFTNNSSSGTGPLTYAWSFGDGGTSAAINPAHTYATSGAYTVRLIAADVNGCKDTLIRSNYISVITVSAGFTMNDSVANCPPFTVNFTNTSTNGVSYLWLFGNGSTSSFTNASNTFTTSGTFIVKLITTNANGCKDTAMHTVLVRPSPSGTFSYSPFTGCGPLSITFSATSINTISITYDFDNGITQTTTASSITYTYTQPGLFIPKVILNNIGGCSTFLIGGDTVKVNKSYAGFTAAPNPVCAGIAVQFTDTSHAFMPGISTYSWNFGDGGTSAIASPTHIYAASGTYTVRQVVVSTANGCRDTAYKTIVVNPVPVVSAGPAVAICNGASIKLTATGAATYTWSPSTSLSSATGDTVRASPTTTTTYTITGTTSGCIGTGTKTVTVNPLPVVSAGGPTVSVCSGAFATLTAGGSASNYVWSPATGLSGTTTASVTASPTTTTTYTVTGTNANGCVNTDTIQVIVKPLPAISAAGNTSICPGSSATLTVSGSSASYVWSPGATLSCTSCTSAIASPAATTTYTVTGTGSNGCTKAATVTVVVNAVPAISVTGNNAICIGGSTTLTAAGASSFSWSPSTGLSCTNCPNPTANPIATTTYTVTGTSSIGCTGTTTFTLTVNPLPAVGVSPNTAICSGASATLTATGASTYSWSPATGLSATTGVSVTANPAATTIYTVTGTNGNGCVNSSTVIVTVNPLPAVSAGSNISICPGGSATLGASGAATYVWSPAAGLSCTACVSPVATPAATTTYTVTGTGSNGCTNTATVTVAINPLPVITIVGVTSLCAGGTTVLTASGASTYSWSPAAGLSCTSCTATTATPTATRTYKVIGTGSTGCMDSAFITVTLHPLPIITVDTPKTACLHTSIQLTAGGGSTYTWSPAAGLSCANCPTPVATPPATTTYAVYGTDTYGCSDSARTTITILPLPPVNAGPDVSSCKLNSVTLNATGAVSYTWSPGAGLSCTACASPIAIPPVSTTYVVTGAGANGCTARDSVILTLYAQPPVNAGPDQTICVGQAAQLQASGAASYIWSPAATLSCFACRTPVAAPASDITYQVSGTDIHGCRDSDMVTITVIQRSPVTIDTGGDFCAGGSIQLHASGGDTYAWTPATGLSCTNCPEPLASPVVTTTYTVIIGQGQCFKDTLTTRVVIYPLPAVNAGPDQNIILGSSAQINVTGTDISRYSWTPSAGLSCTDCARPVATPDVNTTYTVSVVSEFGCTASDSIRISVRCDGSQIWMPNTFTPNADGHNDFFYPHGKGISLINRLRIYDRWGELILDRTNIPVNDINYGWDGTYKNQTLKPDVFVWILNATCTNGEPLELKGDISLIR